MENVCTAHANLKEKGQVEGLSVVCPLWADTGAPVESLFLCSMGGGTKIVRSSGRIGLPWLPGFCSGGFS